MITVLPILVAYDRIFIASWQEMLRRRGLFYLAVAAIWALPLVIFLPTMFQAGSSGSGFVLPTLPMEVYWMTEAWVLLYYLWICIFPYPQYLSYRDWPLTRAWSDFWPAGLAVGSLLLMTRWLLSWYPWLGFLGLWFFGILSITSVVPLLDVAFEHRLYLPLAAIVTLAVVGGYLGVQKGFQGKIRILVGTLAALGVSSVLIWLTVARNADYRDEVHLWASVCEWNPDSPDALFTIAQAYDANDDIDRALAYYTQCMKNKAIIAHLVLFWPAPVQAGSMGGRIQASAILVSAPGISPQGRIMTSAKATGFLASTGSRIPFPQSSRAGPSYGPVPFRAGADAGGTKSCKRGPGML